MSIKAKVAVIGAGPAGLFCAYEYARLGAQVTVFERGKVSAHRVCPDVDCKNCAFRSNCAILCGEGGAGGFSDGKVTLSTGRGVQVGNELDFSQFEEEIKDVDFICELYGSNSTYFKPVERPSCLEGTDFEFESYPLRLYGTEGIRNMFSNMVNHMEQNLGVHFKWDITVNTIKLWLNPTIYYTGTNDDLGFSKEFDYVVVAIGSFSSDFMVLLARENSIQLDWKGPAGIGIRLESEESLMEPLMSEFYDFKIYLEHKWHGQRIQYRSFCVNRGGAIVNENRMGTQPIVSINGRSEFPSTGRSNLAILAKIPDGKSTVKDIAQTINRMAGGLPGVQSAKRFVRPDPYIADNDLWGEHQYFVWGAKMRNSKFVDVTYAFPPDLGEGFRRYLFELDKVMPGIIDHPTSLIYAPEVKYHMPRWPLLEGFVVDGLDKVQVIGNAGGYTESISTAAVMGLVSARFRMG